MRKLSIQAVTQFLLLVALLCPVTICSGYTYLQAGIDSNILVDGSRVIFAQADHSLTVLALETGSVLARDKDRNFSGTFIRVGGGILQLNDQSITLLDADHFGVIWTAPCRGEPRVSGDAVVSSDGQRRVECRVLDTGVVRWTYEFPGEAAIMVESGKVLVHRSSLVDPHHAASTALLDLQSGKVLFSKSALPGTDWIATFFDGTNVFVVQGAYDEEEEDYRPERLLVWDTRGAGTNVLVIPANMRHAIRDGAAFELGGRTFCRGRVFSSRASVPAELRTRVASPVTQTNESLKAFESVHELGEGRTLIQRAKYLAGQDGGGPAFVMEIEMQSPTNRWSGVLSYLLDRGRIMSVTRSQGRIVIGTDFGQVECIDEATGESKWLYVFPTLHRTMSASSRGLAPMETEAAAIFRRENSGAPVSGLHLINGKAGTPHVIVDPQPMNPYADLGRDLALAWGGCALGLMLLLGIQFLPRIRFQEPHVAGTLVVWVTFLVFGFGLLFGRVSPGSAFTLRIVVGIGFALGVFNAVRSVRAGLRAEAMILTITIAALGVLIWMGMA